MQARPHTYPELLGDLIDEVRKNSQVRGFTSFRRTRAEHYNAYSVPMRLAEILDVLQKYAGISDLSGLRCFDGACGFGGLALYMATEGSASNVIAADINCESLRAIASVVARSKLHTIQVLRGSLQEVPMRADTIDLSLLYDCLVYKAIDIPVALAEHRRVLRPGGRLLIKVANAWSPLALPFSVPGIRRFARPVLGRLAASADRLLLSDAMELLSARAMQRVVLASGFADVRIFDRYRRADRGLYRYFVPDIIIAATKPPVSTIVPG